MCARFKILAEISQFCVLPLTSGKIYTEISRFSYCSGTVSLVQLKQLVKNGIAP